MNRYICLFFTLFIVYIPFASAQYKLQGVVRDSATNETLPDAAVPQRKEQGLHCPDHRLHSESLFL